MVQRPASHRPSDSRGQQPRRREEGRGDPPPADADERKVIHLIECVECGNEAWPKQADGVTPMPADTIKMKLPAYGVCPACSGKQIKKIEIVPTVDHVSAHRRK